MSTTPPPDTLTAALAWHAAGASVVRVALDGTKRPLGDWKEAQSVRADEATLRSWFSTGHPGLGVVMGAVSGGLEMFEFEGRAVAEGVHQRYNEIVEASGLGEVWARIKSGYCDRTPSGGIHVVWRVTDGAALGNTKLATRPARPEELTDKERGVLATRPDKIFTRDLVETRGEGGQSVMAPSHGPVHDTGRPYELLAGSAATVATVSADERDALFEIARMLDQMPVAIAPVPAQRDDSAAFLAGGQPRRSEQGGISPGDDFEARTPWIDILGPHGWEVAFTSGHTTYWRRPGKRLGVSATTGHDPARDRLFVFTSSTEFDQERPYTKFGAYAFLEHHGDYSAAAKELSRRGFGERARHLRPVPPAAPLAVDARPASVGATALAIEAPRVEERVEQQVDIRRGIDITHEPDAIIAITDALRAGVIPDTYVRNGELVQIIELSGAALVGDRLSLKRAVTSVGPDSMRRLLARHAEVYRLKASRKEGEGPAEVPSSPTVSVCKAVLTETAWPGISALANIIGAPVLRPDGTILQAPGYDSATHLFYDPHADLPAIPDLPTPEQVRAALDFLLDEVLGDFPWAGPADRANYVALLVSPILRPYIGGLMPLGAISASDRGSGKTLLTDIIGTLYGATVRPWVSDDDELRKAVTSLLLGSNPVIVLDNIGERDSVEAPTLAMLLTSQAWGDRILGRSEQTLLVNDRLWLVTGNNIRFGGDIAQRTVLVRLDPKCARPDLRTGFHIPDLDEWLEDDVNRGRLLAALLVLVRSWIASGAPRADIAMRSFRRWARAAGGFVAFHGLEGFMTNVDQLEEQDEEAAAWGSFLTVWFQRYGSEPKTSAELRQSAQSMSGFGFDDPWNGTFLTRADGSLPTPKGLGMMLAGRRGRYFGDLVLQGIYDKHRKTWFYNVERDAKDGA